MRKFLLIVTACLFCVSCGVRDKFTCQYCGDKRDLTFDHLLPKSKGGVSDWENVVTACSVCNVKKRR